MTSHELWVEQAKLWSTAFQGADYYGVYITACVGRGVCLLVHGVCLTLRMYPARIRHRMEDLFQTYYPPSDPDSYLWPLTKEGADCRVLACLFMAEICDD